MEKRNSWISSDVDLNNPSLKLFCFPYAGGNSSIFRNWKQFSSHDISILPIEMPGKGRRFGEVPFDCVEKLVADCSKWFQNNVKTDFAFFGHSLGGLIAFELTKALENVNNGPKLLVLSACSSPSFSKPIKDRIISDSELIQTLANLNGTPKQLLENKEFLECMLPILKADFKMFNNYIPSPRKTVNCPILALSGTEDSLVDFQAMADWQNYTANSFALKVFDGDHFFLHQYENEIVNHIKAKIHQGASNVMST